MNQLSKELVRIAKEVDGGQLRTAENQIRTAENGLNGNYDAVRTLVEKLKSNNMFDFQVGGLIDEIAKGVALEAVTGDKYSGKTRAAFNDVLDNWNYLVQLARELR